MDRVTHFLLVTALLLIIIVSVTWLLGASCATGKVAGYISSHRNAIEDIRHKLKERRLRNEVEDLLDTEKEKIVS
jgi:hypothetical protein